MHISVLRRQKNLHNRRGFGRTQKLFFAIRERKARQLRKERQSLIRHQHKCVRTEQSPGVRLRKIELRLQCVARNKFNLDAIPSGLQKIGRNLNARRKGRLLLQHSLAIHEESRSDDLFCNRRRYVKPDSQCRSFAKPHMLWQPNEESGVIPTTAFVHLWEEMQTNQRKLRRKPGWSIFLRSNQTSQAHQN